MQKRNIFLFVSFIILMSCSSSIENDVDESASECFNTSTNISALDSIVIHNSNPGVWRGSFSNEAIKINFTTTIGVDDETETYNFILSKNENCLQKERAYKFYDGKLVDISAVTEMEILEFYIKNWEENRHLSGLIVYQDPHDQKTYSKKIWIDNFVEDNTQTSQIKTFENCYAGKLPINIDVDEDNITDFILTYVEEKNIGNIPKFDTYTIKLVSTSSKNEILSPIRNSPPYTIVFEPPFSTENTRQYFGGVKSELDVFYEFNTPYESYNYFLSNNLTYKGILQNNTSDYFLISKEINGKKHYGWIKFELDTSNCSASLLFAYLNDNSETHVSIQ